MGAAFQGKHRLDRSCVGRELVPHTINCQPDLLAGAPSPQVEVLLLGPAGLGQPDLVLRDLGTRETPNLQPATRPGTLPSHRMESRDQGGPGTGN